MYVLAWTCVQIIWFMGVAGENEVTKEEAPLLSDL